MNRWRKQEVDRACTIQVFDPTGEEVYSASGSEVVRWGGCHAWEDGEYYLALHDVTAQQGTTTKLEYQHIDKYAILSTDVLTVGNGGVSTISHDGNGFYYLKSISLVHTETGEEIKAFDIEFLSDNKVRASYDFNDATVGSYVQKFQFDEEERINSQYITIEKEKDIELALSVKYSSTFLRGTSSTYTVTIKNNGNMTAYNVPIYAYISSSSENGIKKISIEGLNLPKLIDGVDLVDWNEDEVKALQQVSDEIDEMHYFIVQRAWNDDVNDSVTVRSNYFFTELKPKESKTIKFNILATETIHSWFTVPDDWNPLTLTDGQQQLVAHRIKSRSAKESYCCIREMVECAANIVADVSCIANIVASEFPETPAATGSAITSCVADAFNTTIQVAGYVMCDDNSVEKSLWDKIHRALTVNSGASTVINCLKKFLPSSIKLVGGNITNLITISTHPVAVTDCISSLAQKKPNCPPPPPKGGPSKPVNSLDPNDITGYTAESGSHFVKKDLVDVNYKIEFENDPEFATASAHVVVVKDTLDGKLFDLATYAPTGIKIGEKMAEVDGAPNFVKTIDMRPAINAIAQVEGAFDKAKGIATWTFTSLDPMTMEPTDDVMQGFLPVNDDNGSGQGEVTFDIKLRNGLANGTEVPNRASIVFDNEEAIMTPTWVNTMDFTAPSSRIRDSRIDGDSITLYFEGRDSGSGVWKYDVYQLAGDAEKWRMVAEGVTADSCRVRYYEGFDYNFSVIATDKAGNVEDKELSVLPELDCDLQLKAGWNWVSTFLNSPQPVAEMFDKGVNRVMSQTHESIKDPVFGVVGQIMSMQPGVGYKVSSEADFTVSYMGRLHNLAESPIEVKKGWNWIAYPYHESREIGMAIVNADEDDLISSQRGYAEFADGTWEGSISSLEAGLGYLYRSATDKTLAFDFQTPSPMAKAASADELRPDTESGVDPHKYPSTMNVTARLYRGGAAITDSHYVVYAMSDDELRGEGRCVNGTHYITVYGDQPVEISFVIEDTDTGDTYEACETVTFTSDAVGSRKSPFTLTFGEATSIAGVESEPNAATHTVSGIKVERIDKPGIYIRNGKKISIPARQQ